MKKPHPLLVLVAALVGIATAVGLALIADCWTDGGEGDLSSWVEATATVLAFGAAGVAAFYAYRVYVIEDRRDELLLQDARQAQSSRFAAWTERRQGRLVILFRNASDLPVTDVVVELTLMATDPQTHAREVIWTEAQPIPLIPPSDEPIPRGLRDPGAYFAARGKVASVSQHVETYLEFTDANNVRWRRDPKGQLDEVEIDPS